jgi:prepilin-type N-terminal cleavage/methylation domain-containing protein
MKIKTNKSSSAFTLIELLVVIAIIAILAAFAVPALTSALKKGQMTGTMNNARQLYIAQFQMSNDGAATGDGTLDWPGSLVTNGTLTTAGLTNDLQGYMNYLLLKGYLKGGDVLKLLTAPAAALTGTFTPAAPPAAESWAFTGGIAALKVYPVLDSDPVSQIYACTHNYDYNTALSAATSQIPYGTNGFIVVHKGGDAAIFKEGQAIETNWPDAVTFQTQVGFKGLPDTYGNPSSTGDPTNTLKYP